MKGKIVLITGANSGIGKETAKSLAKMGATIIMACRNIELSMEAQKEIKDVSRDGNVELMKLDLSSIESIRKFTADFVNRYDQLHVLINNAGVFCEAREETEDGFEKTMGVNYFGMFLLTHLLLPIIKKTEKARIINITSKAAFHGNLRFEDLNFRKQYHGFKAYSASKLAVILFTQQLSRELKGSGIVVNSVHPGGAVATNMWKGNTLMMKVMGRIIKLFSSSPKEGAETSVYLATSLDVEGITGKLFHKNEVMKYSNNCLDLQLQNKLWDYSIEATKLKSINDVEKSNTKKLT